MGIDETRNKFTATPLKNPARFQPWLYANNHTFVDGDIAQDPAAGENVEVANVLDQKIARNFAKRSINGGSR
jgi:hypothetical protein